MVSSIEGLGNSSIVPFRRQLFLNRHVHLEYDSGGSNIYFYKKDSLETSKLQAGPIWDFSGCMGKVPFKGEWSYSHYPDNYVNYNGELLKRDEFLIEYAKCWERVKNGIVETVLPDYSCWQHQKA